MNAGFKSNVDARAIKLSSIAVLILITGCHQPGGEPSAPEMRATTKPTPISIGMSLDTARTLLVSHGAVELGTGEPRENAHYFRFPTGVFLRLDTRKDGDRPPTIGALSARTTPQSWNGTIDPRGQFYESFVSIDEYDFDRPIVKPLTANSPIPTTQSVAVPPMLRVGTNLVDAKKRLLARGAEETVYEIETTDPKVQLRWFRLPAGPVLELVSRRVRQNAYELEQMRISTYEPKSWKSKLDPEHEKFFKSFKPISEYDLSLPPEMQPPATTTKAPP